MSGSARQTAYVRRTLYALKKEYGGPMTIYQTLDEEIDQRTGRAEPRRRQVEIDRAILLPTALGRTFKYNRAFIGSDRSFSYGATYDINTRIVLIDGDDIPDGMKLDKSCIAVIDDIRYEIKTSERAEDGVCLIVTMKETVGSLPYAVYNLGVVNNLHMDQSLKNES
jgi:hypothetical protein